MEPKSVRQKKLAKFSLLKFWSGTTRECSDSVLYFGRKEGDLQNLQTPESERTEEEGGEMGGDREEFNNRHRDDTDWKKFILGVPTFKMW